MYCGAERERKEREEKKALKKEKRIPFDFTVAFEAASDETSNFRENIMKKKLRMKIGKETK